MSESELKATENIANSFEPSAEPVLPVKKAKRPVTMTDAKKAQLETARLKLAEARKSKKVNSEVDDKQKEIKSWVHGICEEYLSTKQQVSSAPSGQKAPQKQEPVIQRVEQPVQQQRVSKEDYFLSLIRNR